MRVDLGFVIPALNEEKSIANVITSLREFGKVIVVNDASEDATAVVAEAAGAIVVTHPLRRGYDGALNSGFAKAAELGLTHVITIDADGQHPVDLVPEMVATFRDGFDLVLGVRHRTQRISELLFALYTKLRFGIADPLCGFKGYALSTYRRVGRFDSYGSIGTELMLRSLAAGARFRELPFYCPERAHGTARFGTAIRSNLRILRALLKGMTIRS